MDKNKISFLDSQHNYYVLPAEYICIWMHSHCRHSMISVHIGHGTVTAQVK